MSKEITLTPTQQEAYALLQKFGTFSYCRQAQSFTAPGSYPKIHPNTAKLLKKMKVVVGTMTKVGNNRKILTKITLKEDNPVQPLIDSGTVKLPVV